MYALSANGRGSIADDRIRTYTMPHGVLRGAGNYGVRLLRPFKRPCRTCMELQARNHFSSNQATRARVEYNVTLPRPDASGRVSLSLWP